MKTVFLFPIVLVMLVAQGCIKPVDVTRDESRRTKVADTTSASVEPFDPLALGDDVFQKELGIGKEESSQQDFGYRVQIGAFSKESSARALEAQEENKFSSPIHIVYEKPFWCVRLGDFKTIEEAETAKKEAIARGYTDARVIEDRIIIKN